MIADRLAALSRGTCPKAISRSVRSRRSSTSDISFPTPADRNAERSPGTCHQTDRKTLKETREAQQECCANHSMHEEGTCRSNEPISAARAGLAVGNRLVDFSGHHCPRVATRFTALREYGGAYHWRADIGQHFVLIQRLQRAQMAVGSNSPLASSRTVSSPASTSPGRSANACFSSSPIANADMRTA